MNFHGPDGRKAKKVVEITTASVACVFMCYTVFCCVHCIRRYKKKDRIPIAPKIVANDEDIFEENATAHNLNQLAEADTV